MFDPTATFKIEFPHSTIGPVSLELRWPTDEEWVQRVYTQRLAFKNLGRGQTEWEQKSNHLKDQELYNKLALNGSPPPAISANEATWVLDHMGAVNVLSVDVEGANAVVRMRVPNGTVFHHLHVPNMDQVVRWKAGASRQLQLPHGAMEHRTNIRAGGELWSELGGRVEGQLGSPPVIHRDQAVRAVIEHIEREMQPEDDEANFT